MNGKNVVVGVLIFCTCAMLGGLLGIFVGYSIADNAQADAYIKYRQQEMTYEDMEEQETEEIEEVEEIEEIEELPPINLSNLGNIHNILDVWKEILLRTSQGNLDKREASKLIYTMSSEIYKRNIPEGFSVYRLKNVITDNGNGKLKALTYSDIRYEGENIAYVDVEENYENKTYAYKLKFVKENNSWCFVAQLEG
ncbi:hypothetical protein [Crassaminicella profunda]|uniref:hypothetical protein n=1 Tax=Crassaminicella profunda TaxID=1286698 RepID=UPI001CA6DDD3|nr:hypothetical protein [Crassaminicella profunda]QZY56076.1 hypothetical protein K7H06_03485 [Crassaminicella profunda]